MPIRYNSPLRYPGGKASIASCLSTIITENGLAGCSYFEPFAGGAGAALHLLRDGVVSELHLNDINPRITAFWDSILREPERFADTIRSIPLTIAEWKKQQDICQRADASKPFELGFAAFYLNRCNRSGVLLGAAPIGGYAQRGKWKMDARFYRETLAERVLTIAKKREHIHITTLDALRFLTHDLPRVRARKPVFVYLDPPYYAKADRLYENAYTDRDHEHLARDIQLQPALKWVMSYDDAPLIRELYTDCQISSLSLQYSLQRKQRTTELLIVPPQVRLPDLDAVTPLDRDQAQSTVA